jgi:hypothetical protein
LIYYNAPYDTWHLQSLLTTRKGASVGPLIAVAPASFPVAYPHGMRSGVFPTTRSKDLACDLAEGAYSLAQVWACPCDLRSGVALASASGAAPCDLRNDVYLEEMSGGFPSQDEDCAAPCVDPMSGVFREMRSGVAPWGASGDVVLHAMKSGVAPLMKIGASGLLLRTVDTRVDATGVCHRGMMGGDLRPKT